MIRLINIDKKNYQNIISLDLGDENIKYVNNISECILEYLYFRKSVIKAIYLDNTSIGFVMIEDKYNTKWITQFLIDKKFQNQGYDSVILKLILRYIQKKYHTKYVYLSIGNLLASNLYLKFGFYQVKDKLSEYYNKNYNKTVYCINLTKFDFNLENKQKLGQSVVKI